MTTITTEAAAIRLLTWLSPAFPVGAFAHSHGLEWAVEAGDIRDAATATAWIGDTLSHGAGRADAILLAHAWRAPDRAALSRIDAIARALAPSRERQAETLAQGAAFARAVAAVWPEAARLLPPSPAYPVAVGAAASGVGLPLLPTLAAYLHAFAANLVSAAVRLVPLGQTDGLRILAALEDAAGRIAREAMEADTDDIGGAVFRGDLAAMRHETQHTRLFRT